MCDSGAKGDPPLCSAYPALALDWGQHADLFALLSRTVRALLAAAPCCFCSFHVILDPTFVSDLRSYVADHLISLAGQDVMSLFFFFSVPLDTNLVYGPAVEYLVVSYSSVTSTSGM
jgi:hypothetical protein